MVFISFPGVCYVLCIWIWWCYMVALNNDRMSNSLNYSFFHVIYILYSITDSKLGNLCSISGTRRIEIHMGADLYFRNMHHYDCLAFDFLLRWKLWAWFNLCRSGLSHRHRYGHLRSRHLLRYGNEHAYINTIQIDEWMYLYIHICIHAYIHAYTNECIHKQMHTHVHACANTHTRQS